MGSVWNQIERERWNDVWQSEIENIRCKGVWGVRGGGSGSWDFTGGEMCERVLRGELKVWWGWGWL